MQNFDWRENLNKIRSWYNARKRLVLSGGFIALVLALLVAAAYSRPGKPAAQLALLPVDIAAQAEAKIKEINYQAEYDERFLRTVNGVAETYSYKLREFKKGVNWKKETYLNDFTLLEAFIRNNDSYSHCAMYPEISCVEKSLAALDDGASARSAMPSGLNGWAQKNIFKTSAYQKDIAVGSESRSAACVSYSFNPGLVTDGDVAALMNSSGGPSASTVGSAAALQAWMKQYDAEVCYDDQTGIVLNYHSIIRQSVSLPTGALMDYESEDTQTIENLRLNPLLPPETFSTSSVREKN